MPADILLVEDDAELLNKLAEAFAIGRPDLEIGTAPHAEGALKFLESNAVRLVISDVQLPGESGLDLLLRTRDRYPRTRFILTTGHPQLLDAREARDRGALRLLHKPFRVVDLLGMADDVLAGEALTGSLDGVPITDLMLLLHITGRTASLVVTAGDGRKGRLFLDRGDVVHAVCEGLEGMEAFREILSWKDAHFATRMDEAAEKESIGWIDVEQTASGKVPRAKILVVDDSRTALHFARNALHNAGYLVETLDNAWVAPLLSRFRPDLVLMDVELSVSINGATAIKAVKDRPFARDMRFVLYSSLPEEKLKTLAEDCGADGYLHKDDSVEKLLQGVAGWLELAGQPA